jgi:hypothetical protein
MKKRILSFVFFAFVLFDCGYTTTTKTPETVAPAKSATQAFTATPSRLPTSSPRPNTVTPTLNPTIQSAATLYKQTQEVESLSIRATQQAMDGFRNTFRNMCDNAPYQTDISPDGNWLAQDCFQDKFQVIGKDNSMIWIVKYDKIFESNGDAGAVWPIYWTKDGRYLFF